MLFCPRCGTLLLVEDSDKGKRLFCRTCPYVHVVSHSFSKKVPIEKKKVDDVLGGASAWENVDKTRSVCPGCRHDEAYFMQIQIRSADEPMTTFYKCCKCKQQWSEN